MAVRSLVAPWPGKTGRVLTRLGERAAREYAEAVGAVAGDVERALRPCVHGGRVRTARPLRLAPWREERMAHRIAALELSATARVAVSLDIEDCYRSIHRDRVADALGALGIDAASREPIDRFLRRVAEAGIPGLPVGPEPSAVLANAVLHGVDDAAEAVGASYLRWFDDMLLFAGSLRGALEAAEDVEVAVRALGLRPHATKRRAAVGPRAIRRLVVAGGAASGGSV